MVGSSFSARLARVWAQALSRLDELAAHFRFSAVRPREPAAQVVRVKTSRRR